MTLKKDKKILIIIPDGVGIRNFVYGDLIFKIDPAIEIVVWHSFPDSLINSLPQKIKDRITLLKLPNYREGIFERILKQGKIYGQFYWKWHEDEIENVLKNRERVKPKRFIDRLVLRASKLVGRLNNTPDKLIRVDRLHKSLVEKSPFFNGYVEKIKSIGPDVVFCSHQRAGLAVPVMAAAQRLGIPTSTFIYSWDNLPKGRMAVHSDYFFVWSEHMKRELISYYPEISEENIKIAGTPQFEVYFKSNLRKEKSDFFSEFGLDPKRKLICFSGDDVTSSPHDELYLRDIAKVIREIPEEERPQIIFRPCPVDHSNRYDEVLKNHPEIVLSKPKWNKGGSESWAHSYPTIDDFSLLNNIVQHSDLVVNVGSTMCFDFAILDKPGIYFNYNPPEAASGWDIRNCYRYPHFRVVHKLNPVYWANSVSDLKDCIFYCLKNAGEKKQERQKWVESMIDNKPENSSDRIAGNLESIIYKEISLIEK